MRVKSLARAGYRRLRAGSRSLERLQRQKVVGAAFLALTAIGILDYLSGVQITLAAAYGIPVLLVAWFVDAESALCLSAYSVGLWILGQGPAGYPNWWVPVVNGLLRLLFYACLV